MAEARSAAEASRSLLEVEECMVVEVIKVVKVVKVMEVRRCEETVAKAVFWFRVSQSELLFGSRARALALPRCHVVALHSHSENSTLDFHAASDKVWGFSNFHS
jgi:hypothetical protein